MYFRSNRRPIKEGERNQPQYSYIEDIEDGRGYTEAKPENLPAKYIETEIPLRLINDMDDKREKIIRCNRKDASAVCMTADLLLMIFCFTAI